MKNGITLNGKIHRIHGLKKNPDYFANFLKNNANDLAVLNKDYGSN